MASAGAQGGRLRSFLDRAAWYLKAAATIHVVRTYVAEFTVVRPGLDRHWVHVRPLGRDICHELCL